MCPHPFPYVGCITGLECGLQSGYIDSLVLEPHQYFLLPCHIRKSEAWTIYPGTGFYRGSRTMRLYPSSYIGNVTGLECGLQSGYIDSLMLEPREYFLLVCYICQIKSRMGQPFFKTRAGKLLPIRGTNHTDNE
jgi:hypothetical protein